MASSSRFFLFVACASSLLPSCTLFNKILPKRRTAGHEVSAARPKLVQAIGTVVLVNVEGAFVLIDSGSGPSPTMGTGAQSRSADGSSSELKLTEIRKRPFVIADIVEGTPQKGDQVFQ